MPGRAAKIAGEVVIGVEGSVFALVLFGEAMTDPGGWTGFLGVLFPALVFAALAALVWRVPGAGLPVVLVAGFLAVGYHLSIAVGVLESDIESGNMSYWELVLAFLPVPVFVLAALHSWHRPLEGGIVLLVLAGLLTVRWVPGLALAAPALVAGALFVVAGLRERHGSGDVAPP